MVAVGRVRLRVAIRSSCPASVRLSSQRHVRALPSLSRPSSIDERATSAHPDLDAHRSRRFCVSPSTPRREHRSCSSHFASRGAGGGRHQTGRRPQAAVGDGRMDVRPRNGRACEAAHRAYSAEIEVWNAAVGFARSLAASASCRVALCDLIVDMAGRSRPASALACVLLSSACRVPGTCVGKWVDPIH